MINRGRKRRKPYWRHRTLCTYGVDIYELKHAIAEAKRLETHSQADQYEIVEEVLYDNDSDLIDLGVQDFFKRVKMAKIGSRHSSPPFWVQHETGRIVDDPSKVRNYLLSLKRQEVLDTVSFKDDVADMKANLRYDGGKAFDRQVEVSEKLYRTHNSWRKDAKDLPVMETISCKTVLGPRTDWKPHVLLTVMNAVSGSLYDFELSVRKSNIANAGEGAFIKLMRVRRVNKKLSKPILLPRRPKVILATLEGASYPIGVKVKCSGFASDDNQSRPNHFRDVTYCDVTVNPTFNSFELGNGKIEIGRYAPFLKQMRMPIYIFAVKDFLFENSPGEWAFDAKCCFKVDKTSYIHKLDITDSSTGEPSHEARCNIAMYVNETAGKRDIAHNVLSSDCNESVVNYAFVTSPSMEEEERGMANKPMRAGDFVEMCTWYTSSYEKVRERKGYGMRNLSGDLKVRMDEMRTLCMQIGTSHVGWQPYTN